MISFKTFNGSLPLIRKFPSWTKKQQYRKDFSRRFYVKAQANDQAQVGATTINVNASPTQLEQDDNGLTPFGVSCPICYKTDFSLRKQPYRGMTVYCERCNRGFEVTENYVDLTVTSGLQARSFRPPSMGTDLFRLPLVTFAYERGWRQNFRNLGSPGPDVEFRKAMDYLQDAQQDDVIVDLSCGSGLFTRRFLSDKRFKKVIAVDYSESMLGETKQRITKDKNLSRDIEKLLLVRADVGRLPFQTDSLGAIYSGAAIHCWPDVQQAFAEVSRVLKPGGIFVASTFIIPGQMGNQIGPLAKQLLPFQLVQQQNLLWEQELQNLSTSVGLQAFGNSYQNRSFILFAVQKPKKST
eukprot:TRINITY_DN16152_c0_g1_i1.p1 TRINITY_DN16152_c0_g1~~TRINITY_DN16152_c0_g1_i1.p1  ORF type:complete len:353 (-),score=28.02 TRINITY_DN16152_c0_g1_i1:307-1365(-)